MSCIIHLEAVSFSLKDAMMMPKIPFLQLLIRRMADANVNAMKNQCWVTKKIIFKQLLREIIDNATLNH